MGKWLALLLLIPGLSFADGWSDTKRIAAEAIYAGHARTFYTGCPYRVTDDKGGGVIEACAYDGPERHAWRATRLEWEHVVPASLLPAHEALCWRETRRRGCEQGDPRAQAMIFDLHNLVPSVGQVNALRGNLRYGERKGMFEPPDCVKGDAARIWLYMHVAHGVEVMPAELAMFVRWAEADPVSPWESERERRIGAHARVRNPFVAGVPPNPAGACPWE